MKTTTRTMILTLLALIFRATVIYAQVTVGSDTPPNATLDVVATTKDGLTAEGIIAPRLTGNELKAKDGVYGAAQTGAMVYVTAPVTSASEKTVNVTTAGYYYFDGTLWQVIKDRTTASNGLTESGNDVQLGGTLTKNTTIAQGANALTFSGTGKTVVSSPLQYNNAAATPGEEKVLISDASGNATWEQLYYTPNGGTAIDNVVELIPERQADWTMDAQKGFRVGSLCHLRLVLTYTGTDTIPIIGNSATYMYPSEERLLKIIHEDFIPLDNSYTNGYIQHTNNYYPAILALTTNSWVVFRVIEKTELQPGERLWLTVVYIPANYSKIIPEQIGF